MRHSFTIGMCLFWAAYFSLLGLGMFELYGYVTRNIP